MGAAAADKASRQEMIRSIESGLRFQTGEVMLPDNIAKITLPPSFRYLPESDAETVLVKLWGNPPGNQTLGMIFPVDVNPGDTNSWGIVITYSDDGYVKDSEADSINYDKLLRQMKKETKESNAERKKEGYATAELVGWAKPPHYDKANHKLYWAKELKFEDSEHNTLNYNIRVLGRHGVLNLNAVATMDLLPKIEENSPEIVSMVNFTEGNRYADFKPGVDRIAAYGIAALVAGGIAAKVGVFKGLIALLIAAKKFIILGIIGLSAFLKKIFGRKDSRA